MGNYRGFKMLYDAEILLRELDITDKEKKKIIQDLKIEFPNDDMLFELHLFCIVQYLKKR